jgi:hypothetical protein
VHSEAGRLLLVTRGETFEDFVNVTYDPLRSNDRTNVDRALLLTSALGELACFTRDARRRAVVQRHIEAVGEVLAQAQVVREGRAADPGTSGRGASPCSGQRRTRRPREQRLTRHVACNEHHDSLIHGVS